MLAGELPAIWTRKYAKGRDWFDFMWYRTRRPPIKPNVNMLQKALDQTGGAGKHDARNWQDLVRDRLTSLDTKVVAAVVHPVDQNGAACRRPFCGTAFLAFHTHFRSD
jgi:hypothetical protein